jgi:hypothetical protein
MLTAALGKGRRKKIWLILAIHGLLNGSDAATA